MAPHPAGMASYGAENVEPEVSDADAEYEEEEDYETVPGPENSHGHVKPEIGDGSDMDAEGEEIDEDAEGEDDDEGEAVGAVKLPNTDLTSSGEDEDAGDADAVIDSDAESKSAGSDVSTGSHSDVSETDAEDEWEEESDTTKEAHEGDAEIKLCLHCHLTEDDDPAPEFEEFLSCTVCGEGAHRQCARANNSFASDEDGEVWRCPNCVEHGLEADSASQVESIDHLSVPKLGRDLSQGGENPDSYSMFHDLIVPNDPLDGSRSLRKRKSTSEEDDVTNSRSMRKRRRASTGASGTHGQVSAPTTPRTRSGAAERSVTEDDHVSTEDQDPSSRTRSSRPRRSMPQRQKAGASISTKDGMGLLICIRVHDKERLGKILSARPKKKRIRDKSKKVQPTYEEPEFSHYPAIDTNYTPFFTFGEREDESKLKPYGGILTEAEADTSKTFPQAVDRKRFEDARLKAEEEWKRKMAAIGTQPDPARSSHKISGPPSKIKCINFGGWEIDTWHAAPYPEEYSRNKVLYICEFCLKYMNSDYVAWRHKLKCPAKHPPGDEIYRDGRFSFFEVDGRKNPVYCQNLCLLAKLFLGSKTLYYDVEPFLFYVMTENNEFGCHFVGYFSKEKRPSSLNNVSCILVLPIHQRKGFGHMLIEFSYLLTRTEKKTGSPEKPLSDMGLVSYRSYWRLILCYQLLDQKDSISVTQISELTGMTADDIVSALEGLRALVRDPVTKTYALRLDHDYFKQYIDKFEEKNWPKINPEALLWTPYVMGRGNLAHYDDAPQLHTVAPREEETNEDAIPEEGVQMVMAAAAAADNEGSTTKGADTAESDVQTPHADLETSGPSNPGTPLTNGYPHTPLPTAATATPHPARTVPPTRFEVFPPIPGMPVSRRRPGRPFGSRRRPATPLRRNHTAPRGSTLTQLAQSGKLSPIGLPRNGSTNRRTRSKLGEMVNGIESDKDNAVENGSPRKSLRHVKDVNAFEARNGSLRRSVAQNDEEEYDEEDDDVDAEGEEDDDAIMGEADA